MLRSRRARRTCSWGCCGTASPARTYRTRERRAWRKDWKV